jgi:aldehyde:ferredoxin oxidoreductase
MITLMEKIVTQRNLVLLRPEELIGDFCFAVLHSEKHNNLNSPMTDRFVDAGKSQYIARHQYWRTVTNSLVYCFFAIVNPYTILELTNAISESNRTLNDLLRCGERAWNLKRIYNLKLGLDLQNEKLPQLLRESLPQGGQEGHVPDLPLMLREYYLACGWNPDTGYPNAEKIMSLNLGFTQQTE